MAGDPVQGECVNLTTFGSSLPFELSQQSQLLYLGCYRAYTCIYLLVSVCEPVVHEFVSYLFEPSDALWLHTLLWQEGPEVHHPLCKGALLQICFKWTSY